MNIKVTCRNCQHTPDIDAHIQEQFKRIEHFLEKERPPQKIEVVVEAHPTHQHFLVTIRLHVATDGFMAKHEGPNLFAEINTVFDRIFEQLRIKKEIRVDRKKNGCDGECRAEEFKRQELLEQARLDIEEKKEEE